MALTAGVLLALALGPTQPAGAQAGWVMNVPNMPNVPNLSTPGLGRHRPQSPLPIQRPLVPNWPQHWLERSPLQPEPWPMLPAPDATQSSLMPLPVPEAEVPVGNVGDRQDILAPVQMPWMAEVSSLPSHSQASQPNLQFSAQLSSPLNAQPSFQPRYRVFVDVPNRAAQAQVQRLVPGGFATMVQGRPVFQVGSFGDRQAANQLMQTLVQRGIWPQIDLQSAPGHK
ncbi:MAG: hypothetical protein HC771_14805 [Synechococcales cyanobacterium CRU_2_2]|nr:hypothetical protein [Synechococcales cyanobacterium CRU_2_2]